MTNAEMARLLDKAGVDLFLLARQTRDARELTPAQRQKMVQLLSTNLTDLAYRLTLEVSTRV